VPQFVDGFLDRVVAGDTVSHAAAMVDRPVRRRRHSELTIKTLCVALLDEASDEVVLLHDVDPEDLNALIALFFEGHGLTLIDHDLTTLH
jgi:hypothetical protein